MATHEEMMSNVASWSYWQIVNNRSRMVTKSDKDAWLMKRYGIDHATAHDISNAVELAGPFWATRDGLVWANTLPLVDESALAQTPPASEPAWSE